MKNVAVMLIILIPIISMAQKERWVYRYSGAPSWQNDCAKSIVYGSDGNLYAVGTSWYDSTNDDFTIASLTNSGVERWIYAHNGIANSDDGAYSVVYGNDGNVYAAGSCYDRDTLCAFTVVSVDPSGMERWFFQYQRPGISYSCARSIVYGADGNLYAAGCARKTTGYDILVASLTNTGAQRWTYRYNGSNSGDDEANSIVYGTNGNIYVAGTSNDFSAFVISLTDSGTARWTYQFREHIEDHAHSVIYGNDGNVYVVGTGITQIGFEMVPHIFVICLDDSGTAQWSFHYPDLGSAAMGVYGADGNLYAAGALGTDMTKFMVISLTNAGVFRWEYGNYTPDNMVGWATSLTYGTDHNIYAAGSISDSVSGLDFAIVSLTNSGLEQWVYQCRPSGNGVANAICFGVDGNIYAAGSTKDSITGDDFTIISLDPRTSIEETQLSMPHIAYFEIYPIPVKRECTICYALTQKTKVTMSMYDITGRLVREIRNENQNSGVYRKTINLADLSQGIYLIRLNTGNCFDTKSLIHIK